MKILSSARLTSAVFALLIVVAAGCNENDNAGRIGRDSGFTADAQELFDQGPFDVGYRELTIRYDAVASDERELRLRVWYPAQEGTEAPRAVYAVADVVELPAPFALDAPPVTDRDDLPLAIYSHGNGGEGLLAYPYGERMASHGWIVVAPNHRGNTALDLLFETGDPFTRVALDRPFDLTAIIDEMESGLLDDELEGKADTSRVYAFGHSFGGYSAFAAGGVDVDFDQLDGCGDLLSEEDCMFLDDPDVEAAYRAGFGDSRVVAIAPQAPALVALDRGQLSELDVPTMLMSGRLDKTTTQEESAEPAWAGIDHPDDLWVEMPDGAHFSFITICHDLAPGVLELFQPDAEQDGCGEEFIASTDAVPVLVAYVLAFGRRHVLDETAWDPVLEGPALGDGFVIRTK